MSYYTVYVVGSILLFDSDYKVSEKIVGMRFSFISWVDGNEINDNGIRDGHFFRLTMYNDEVYCHMHYFFIFCFSVYRVGHDIGNTEQLLYVTTIRYALKNY